MPSFLTPNSFGSSRDLREDNTCHNPAGSSKGGQFARKETCGGGTAVPTASDPHEKVIDALLTGSVTQAEPLGGGINGAQKITVEDGDGNVTEAVYKAEVREHWRGAFANPDINTLRENTDFSLAEREVAAYEVDKAIGTDLVTPTVLRKDVGDNADSSDPDDEQNDYNDEDDARDEYEQWAEGERERKLSAADNALYEQYNSRRQSYVQDVKNRVSDLAGIYNEILDDHPELTVDPKEQYGENIDAHPALHALTGGTVGFNVRKRGQEVIDPLDVFERAGVTDLTPLSQREKANVKAILYKMIAEEGYGQLGDLDTSKAASNFVSYIDWQDREGLYPDPSIMGFDEWRRDRGYRFAGDSGGNGGNRVANPHAPHPKGGSVALWMEAQWGGSMTTEHYHRFAVLDYVIGTLDRHGNNHLIRTNGEPAAIDNGYSFPGHHPPLFRSSMVTHGIMRGGDREKTPEPLRAKLKTGVDRFISGLDDFFKRHPSMSEKERTQLAYRAKKVGKALETADGLYNLWRNHRVLD